MQSQAARQLLSQGQLPQADAYLDCLAAVVQEAHADVREYILGSRSGLRTGLPFLPALEDYLRRFGESYCIDAKLSVEPGLAGERLEPMVAAQLLRIIQETLTNVRKHARASRVRVRLGITDSFAEAIIQDDGVGFDPEALDAARGQRYGLLFMRDRAQQVGGSVDVRSGSDQGTMVIIRVPMRKEHV
jgi:signal transduction histidine kinase